MKTSTIIIPGKFELSLADIAAFLPERVSSEELCDVDVENLHLSEESVDRELGFVSYPYAIDSFKKSFKMKLFKLQVGNSTKNGLLIWAFYFEGCLVGLDTCYIDLAWELPTERSHYCLFFRASDLSKVMAFYSGLKEGFRMLTATKLRFSAAN